MSTDWEPINRLSEWFFAQTPLIYHDQRVVYIYAITSTTIEISYDGTGKVNLPIDSVTAFVDLKPLTTDEIPLYQPQPAYETMLLAAPDWHATRYRATLI